MTTLARFLESRTYFQSHMRQVLPLLHVLEVQFTLNHQVEVFQLDIIQTSRDKNRERIAKGLTDNYPKKSFTPSIDF